MELSDTNDLLGRPHLLPHVQLHPYADGVCSGPLAVMVDGETWSAAEQFAALLQDNRAALTVGGRTGGAGCGNSWGGTPTTPTHIGATLHLPDCARYRRDGSNEVRGIMPDVAVAWRANDGRALKASLRDGTLGSLLARSDHTASTKPAR